MSKYLIEYYPVPPNEWFHIYNVDRTNQDAYEMYREAKAQRDITEDGEIFGWNNSWWCLVETESVMSAINIFRQLTRQKIRKTCQNPVLTRDEIVYELRSSKIFGRAYESCD